MKRNKNAYAPISGFYDLRAFDIPAKEFMQFWNVQLFLSEAETQRRNGYVHPQINAVKDLSAKYQQALFEYPIIKPDLI